MNETNTLMLPSNDLYRLARKLKKNDTAVVPIKRDGSKAPDRLEVRSLHNRLPTDQELLDWFPDGKHCKGMGILQMRGRETLDIDVDNCPKRKELAGRFLAAVKKELPGLLQRLPVVATPSGGIHIYYRCEETQGNQPLAKLATPDEKDPNKTKGKVFIETRGTGGYVISPFNPIDVHPDRRLYRLTSGIEIDKTPTITAEERQKLFAIARSFGDFVQAERPSIPERPADENENDNRPGSLFNRRANWDEILEPHGWEYLWSSGEGDHWRRPDKSERATSAVVYHFDDDQDRLVVYSSNASPFESWSGSNSISYTKFSAYALLNHGGDFAAAARDVAEQGYREVGLSISPDDEAAISAMQEIPTVSLTDTVAEEDDFDLAAGEISEPMTKPEPTIITTITDDIRDNTLYSYLWQGNHGQFLTDAQRQRRIKTTNEALTYVPKGFFSDYLTMAAPTTDAPLWFHIASSISLAAHWLNRRVWIMTGDTRTYPCFWIGLLAASSVCRKSSSINIMRNLLREDLIFANTLPDYFTMDALLESLGYPILPPGKDGNGDISSANQIEDYRVAARLKESRDPHFLKGVGLFHLNEIGSWLNQLNKTYNQGGKQILTEWFDCPPEYIKKTKTQGGSYIYRPIVSILGASTVEWLASNCQEDDIGSGFLPRWLFFSAKSSDFVLGERDPSSDLAKIKIKQHQEQIMDYAGEIQLSAEAKAYHWDWRVALDNGLSGAVASWAARMGDYCLKVALVFEATTTRGRTVSLDNIRLACRLINRLKLDLEGLLADQVSFDENGKLRNKFLDSLKRHGGVLTHTDALNNIRGIDAASIKLVVNTLQQSDRITVESIKCKNGRNSFLYHLV